ncbi:MAG: nucleotidyltransferase family protein [Pseudonocardiaceae bacterium]
MLDNRKTRACPLVKVKSRVPWSPQFAFGSVARGEADADSDLDLLIDMDPGHGYFEMAGFALEVEDLLGIFTQVATVGGLKLRIQDQVLGEAVAV